jgi:GxxExxY protein
MKNSYVSLQDVKNPVKYTLIKNS